MSAGAGDGLASPVPPSDDENVEDFNSRGARSRGVRGPQLPAGSLDEREQYRMFQRFLESQRHPRRRDVEESDGDGNLEGRGNSGPPPEWDGQTPFEDYLIRARLWVVRPSNRSSIWPKTLRGFHQVPMQRNS